MDLERGLKRLGLAAFGLAASAPTAAALIESHIEERRKGL